MGRLVIVDTSIWIDHLRSPDERLGDLLRLAQVRMHPYVVGEIALGNLPDRQKLLFFMDRLVAAPIASNDNVLTLIERRALFGSGIGYVDAHLVASAFLIDAMLWSRDKRLLAVAQNLGIALSAH